MQNYLCQLQDALGKCSIVSILSKLIMLRDPLAEHCQFVICAIAWETFPDFVKCLSVCYRYRKTVQGGFNTYSISNFCSARVLELVFISWQK